MDILDDWIFVACLDRMGSVKLIGPVTGTTWVVTRKGTWVRVEDIEIINMEVEYYCFKERRMIKTNKGVFLARPNFFQLKEKPI